MKSVFSENTLHIFWQQNISYEPFYIQNKLGDILYHLIQSHLVQLFYELGKKATENAKKKLKTTNYGRMVRTVDGALDLKLDFF